MTTIEPVEVVCGETGRDLTIPMLDSDGNPINLGGAAVKLQGHSSELPGSDLDVAGTIFSANDGKARWVGIGDETKYVDQTSDLVDLASATYTCRVQATISTKVIYSPKFTITWVRKPI